MLKKERTADKTVGKLCEKILLPTSEGVLTLQIATKFMKYIPVLH
jgi:hypothetical protein